MWLVVAISEYFLLSDLIGNQTTKQSWCRYESMIESPVTLLKIIEGNLTKEFYLRTIHSPTIGIGVVGEE